MLFQKKKLQKKRFQFLETIFQNSSNEILMFNIFIENKLHNFVQYLLFSREIFSNCYFSKYLHKKDKFFSVKTAVRLEL